MNGTLLWLSFFFLRKSQVTCRSRILAKQMEMTSFVRITTLQKVELALPDWEVVYETAI